jgi:pyridoxamine 5'-phosphate oxidase
MNNEVLSTNTGTNETPFPIFRQWYKQEQKLTKVRISSACCLSTNGIDGFPNARFVSLKDILEGCFIITGTLTARKGIEINNSDKVALSFWWTETERQIRIQGRATKISGQLADRYFSERNRESQIISIVSDQGQEIENKATLIKKYDTIELAYQNTVLTRPENWGGYYIEPIRIEFLEFNQTRFHDRKLYEFINEQWIVKQLQP